MKDYRYLLLFRWLLINLVGVFLLSVAYVYGGIDLVLASDKTYLSVLIFGVFLCGLVISGFKAFQLSREINHVKNLKEKSKWRRMILDMEKEGTNHARIIETLRIRLISRNTWLKWLANSLVLLGLIGTVVGFIIALSGVDPSLVSDIDVIGKMIAILISGLATALYTTLVGAVFNVWLSANHLLLSQGTANLMASLMEDKNTNLIVVEEIDQDV